MIVSHRHRFVFLKTFKTASTSIELALSPLCGPEDVLTPLDPTDEARRAGAGARNWIVPFRCRSLAGRLRSLIGAASREQLGFHEHMPAAAARRMLGGEIWNGYFKFAAVRNPWDQLVSQYHWKYRSHAAPPSFERFARHTVRRRRLNDSIYAIGGRPAMDDYVRYEALSEDLARVFSRLGLGVPPPLPHSKSGLRPAGDYRDYYDADLRDLIGRAARWEIDRFGYRF